jgi:hypothetical protein
LSADTTGDDLTGGVVSTSFTGDMAAGAAAGIGEGLRGAGAGMGEEPSSSSMSSSSMSAANGLVILGFSMSSKSVSDAASDGVPFFFTPMLLYLHSRITFSFPTSFPSTGSDNSFFTSDCRHHSCIRNVQTMNEKT